MTWNNVLNSRARRATSIHVIRTCIHTPQYTCIRLFSTNRAHDANIDMNMLLQSFPTVEFAMAYGSGVFQQLGYAPTTSNVQNPTISDARQKQPQDIVQKQAQDIVQKQAQDTIQEKQHGSNISAPMIDLVFAVRDPLVWHRENMECNIDHYAGVGMLGSRIVSQIQDNFGAGIYYNTMVPLPMRLGASRRQQMKYGVISSSALIDDLTRWRTLYVAGRMHKPVHIFQCANEQFMYAARTNLEHAVHASLIQLPAKFTLEQLFMTIASLSYVGDFRMIIGENPYKVRNIVLHNTERFIKLYSPILRSCQSLALPTWLKNVSSTTVFDQTRQSELLHTVIEQDDSSAARIALCRTLPTWVQSSMASTHAVYCMHAEDDPTHPSEDTMKKTFNPFAHAVQPWARLMSWQRSRVGHNRRFVRGKDSYLQPQNDIPHARYGNTEALYQAVSHRGRYTGPYLASLLQPTLARVVGRFSRTQTFKGIITAGFFKTIVYAFAKLRKQAKAISSGKPKPSKS